MKKLKFGSIALVVFFACFTSCSPDDDLSGDLIIEENPNPNPDPVQQTDWKI